MDWPVGPQTLDNPAHKKEKENFEDVVDNREKEAGEWSVSGDG